MLKCFEDCAKDGADFISIESTGGKEINDDTLMNADIKRVIFSLGVYDESDSACGFSNTAMVLAEKGYIPRVFAAVVRVATVPISLVAFEIGAVGPSKDCAYEDRNFKPCLALPSSYCKNTSSNISGNLVLSLENKSDIDNLSAKYA